MYFVTKRLIIFIFLTKMSVCLFRCKVRGDRGGYLTRMVEEGTIRREPECVGMLNPVCIY